MSPLLTLLIGLLVGGLLVWLHEALQRRAHRVAVRRAAAFGYAAEQNAREMLEDAGFRVVEEQPVGNYTYWIDDAEQQAEMCPDYLVQAEGQKFVVEVKTGRGRRPTSRSTRRQLLEYALYFDEVAGAILVDAEAGRIHRVDFPSGPPKRITHSWVTAVALAVGGVLGWILRGIH